MRKLAVFIATGFGSGFLPWAPGSWGSLVVLIPAWWLLDISIWYTLGLIALFFVLGVVTADEADRHFSTEDKKVHDDNRIVMDEFVGMLITILPLFYFEKSLLHFGMAFLIFRLFDTLKFGLAKAADRMHNRWGVMLDDLFAGLHAGIFFFIALWLMYRVW